MVKNQSARPNVGASQLVSGGVNHLATYLSPQEYVSELQQLLTSAKHPRTIDLLQKALAEATSPTPHLNGEAESKPPAESAGEDMKPIKKQKDNAISMAKIKNYGTLDMFAAAKLYSEPHFK